MSMWEEFNRFDEHQWRSPHMPDVATVRGT